MATWIRTALISMPLLAVFAAGCDKKVKITFINTTEQDRMLTLSTPNERHQDLGTLAANTGKVYVELKFKKDELPAPCHWRAGDITGSFTVDKKTKEKNLIYIRPDGSTGLVDTNSEMKVKREIEVEQEEQHEVVE